jgi:hypothetical protein
VGIGGEQRGQAIGGEHRDRQRRDQLVAVGLAEQREARHVLGQPRQHAAGAEILA